MMRNIVLYGDCLTKLKEIPDRYVQTCVTLEQAGERDAARQMMSSEDP